MVALDIQKYAIDPKYDVIKDAGGQIVQIKAKPVEYVSSIDKETGKQQTSTYTPHIISFVEGKPVREEFYDINPSVITRSTRQQVPYTPVIVSYDPSGNVTRRQEFKWDWTNKGRGSVIPKLDEKFENGQLTYRYDAKAGSYVKITDVGAGTVTTTPSISPSRSESYTFGSYGYNKLNPQPTVAPKGVGWFDSKQQAFVTSEGKKFPSTTASWTPQGYVALDTPLNLRKNESYYDAKIGGVITGGGKFYSSNSAFAPQGTTLIGTTALQSRATTESPKIQQFKITGEETAKDIAIMSYTVSAPAGYKTPAGEGVLPLPEGYIGTQEGMMGITGEVIKQRNVVQEFHLRNKEMYDWSQKKYAAGEAVIDVPTLGIEDIGGGARQASVRFNINPGENVPESIKPVIPTKARAEFDIAFGWKPPVSPEQSAKEEAGFMQHLGAVVGTGTVAVTSAAGKIKESVTERPILSSTLGVLASPYFGYEYLSGKASEAIKKRTPGTLKEALTGGDTGRIGLPSDLPPAVRKYTEFIGGFQSGLYSKFRERPLDIPATYLLSYGAGGVLSSAGAVAKGTAAAYGATVPFLKYAPQVVNYGGKVIGGAMLLGSAGLVGLRMAAQPTATGKGDVLAKSAYYAVPGIMGFTAGAQSKVLPRFEYIEQAVPVDVSQEMVGGVPTPKIVTQIAYKGFGWRVSTKGGPVFGAGLQPEIVEQQVGTMLSSGGEPIGPMYKVMPSSSSPIALPTAYSLGKGAIPIDITRSVSPLSIGGPSQEALLVTSAKKYYPKFYGPESITAETSTAQSVRNLGYYRGETPKEFIADIGTRQVPKPVVREVARLAGESGAEIYGSSASQSQFKTPYYRAAGGSRVVGDIDIALIRGNVGPKKTTEFAGVAVQRISDAGGVARQSPMNAQVVEIVGIEKPGQYGKFLDIHYKGEQYAGLAGDEAFGVQLFQPVQQTPIVAGERGTVGLMPRGESLARKAASVFSITPEGFQPETNRAKDIPDLMAQLIELGGKSKGAKASNAQQALADIRTLFPGVEPTTGTVTTVSSGGAVSKASSIASQGIFAGIIPIASPTPSKASTASYRSTGAYLGFPSVVASPKPSRSASPSVSLTSPYLTPYVSPSPSRGVRVSPSVSMSVSPYTSPSVSSYVSPSVSPSISPSVSQSVSAYTSPSVSSYVSPSVSPSVSPYYYTNYPYPPSVPRLGGLDQATGGYNKRRNKRKYKYTADLRAIMLGEYSYNQPGKGLFTGQERRFIILPRGTKTPNVQFTF